MVEGRRVIPTNWAIFKKLYIALSLSGYYFDSTDTSSQMFPLETLALGNMLSHIADESVMDSG